jgi:hypothetical protein
MENTMDSVARGGEKSAMQNAKSAGSTLKLVVLWLAVCIPMLWGVMKALEDVGNLLP